MKRTTLLLIVLCLSVLGLKAQIYHDGDKASLRTYLMLPSGEAGEANFQRVGLTPTDTLNWETNETWIANIAGLTWDTTVTPRRLTKINWFNKKLGSTLTLSCDKLQDLRCFTNAALTGLNLSGCTGLTFVNASGCTTLPSINVSGCTALDSLNINGCTNIASINNTNCPALIYLNISRCTKLFPVDFTKFTTLTYLNINECGLSSVDVSPLVNLKNFTCELNSFKKINVSTLRKLEIFSCSTNPIDSLDVSQCDSLQKLTCNNNAANKKMLYLNVSGLKKLKEIVCYNNLLTSLDVSQNPALEKLSCYRNLFEKIDVSKCPNLNTLQCSENQLTGILDLSHNPKIDKLEIYTNKLTGVNITGCTVLKSIQLQTNQFKFSTLPEKLSSYTTYYYAPQDTIKNLSARCKKAINLSAEYSIKKGDSTKITTYNWFDITSGTPVAITDGFTATEGIFVFDSSFNGKKVCCEMKNDAFWGTNANTNLSLIYEATFVGIAPPAIYNDLDKEKLCNFLRQPSADSNVSKLNLDKLGLTAADTLEWDIDEAWIDKLGANVSWTETTPKQLTGIYWNQKGLAGKLDLAGLKMLSFVTFDENKVTDLNIKGCTGLETLRFATNKVRALDATSCTELQELVSAANATLSDLKVSGLSKLEKLWCYANDLPTLNVSGLINLKSLYCNENQIDGTLDLSNLSKLEDLHCEDNFIKELITAKCDSLKKLTCGNNRLKTLNFDGSTTKLHRLSCPTNEIETLDLSSFSSLIYLSCFSNKIESLDLTNHPDFYEINCTFNPIRQLNATGTKLGWVNCYMGRFKFSTLPKNESITFYRYAPQQTALTTGIKCNEEIDLSDEYKITFKGKTAYTTYTWYVMTGETTKETDPITTGYTENQGVFVFDTSFSGKRLICLMKNDCFWNAGNPMTELTLEHIYEFDTYTKPDAIANTPKDKNFIHIYPNPANVGNITIETKEITGKINVSIYTVSGQEIYKGVVGNGTQKLPVSINSSGIYFVKTSTSTMTQTTKLVVQ